MFLFFRCVRILGKLENIRVVQLSLFQGIATAMKVAPTVEMKASDNPALENVEPDPTIFCTAFKKNRFYLVRWCEAFWEIFFIIYRFLLDLIITWDFFCSFLSENQRTQRVLTRIETSSTKSPQRRKWWQPRRPRGPREYLTAPSSTPPWETFTSSSSPSSKSNTGMDVGWPHRLCSNSQIKTKSSRRLLHRCPKTVENFCVHSRNGYYNGHIFHRVIKVNSAVWSLDFSARQVSNLLYYCDHLYLLHVAYRDSWSRPEIPPAPAWEVRASGEGSLRTNSRPRWDTTDHTLSAWPMQAPAPTAHSSSSLLYPLWVIHLF